MRIPEIVLGALLTIALLAIGAAVGSGYQHQTSNASNDTFGQWLFHDAAGFFTLLLVVIGAFQLWLFFRQLRMIRESLEDAKVSAQAAESAAKAAESQAATATDTLEAMRDTTKRQLRAYVDVTGVRILFADGEYQPNIRVTFQNGGQTPAYKLVNKLGLGISIIGPPNFRAFQDSRNFADLGIGRDMATTSLIPQALWNSFKDAITARGIKFFVYGEIEYSDTFGDAHWTRYRLELFPDDEGIKEDGFVFSSEGNESN